MAEQERFDSIDIDVVKKKYYNASKVQELVGELQSRVQSLTAENARLSGELRSLSSKKDQISDTLLSAREISAQIIEDAKAEADRLVSDANERARSIIDAAEAERKALIARTANEQERAVELLESGYERMKALHLSSIELINDDWQSFLCSLFPDEERAGDAAEAPAEDEAAAEQEGDALPGDLSDKISSIAKELYSIEHDDEEATV